MPVIALLRTALWAFSMLFGGLGVFFLYLSFLQPRFAVDALVFLGAASAIVYFVPQR